MKTPILDLPTALVCAIGHLALSPLATAAPVPDGWQQLTTVLGD